MPSIKLELRIDSPKVQRTKAEKEERSVSTLTDVMERFNNYERWAVLGENEDEGSDLLEDFLDVLRAFLKSHPDAIALLRGSTSIRLKEHGPIVSVEISSGGRKGTEWIKLY